MHSPSSRTIFFVLLLAGFWSAGAAPPALPDADEFAQYVLKTAHNYPTDGTNDYYWPKQGEWKGVTQDIVYNGQVVAKGDPQGRCHCSGITWEVFMRSLDAYNKDHAEKVLNTWSTEDVNKFQFLWFGSDGDKHCIHHAVTSFGIGQEIKPDDAKPGDFVQLWRHSGSGHSCIFQEWVRDEHGKIVALKYWSTQKGTHGISVNQEPVSDEKGIDLSHTYIVRIGTSKPAAKP